MNQQQYLKRFKEITEEMYRITEMKNKDYSWVNATDAFANFRVVEEFWIKTEDWFITRILDKVKRISNLTRQENFVADEKIWDTLKDLSNYAILFLLYLESKNEFEIKNEELYVSDYKEIEKQRKKEAISFLKENDMYTPENIALIDAVKFTTDAIEIWWVRWSYNNLKASDVWMDYTTDTSKNQVDYTQAHVFKWEWVFDKEDYFTYEAITQVQAQWKIKLPTDTDMENTLKALPWYKKIWSRGKWSAKILSILLWTQMSGFLRAGKWLDSNALGYIWSVSPHSSYVNIAWACKRDSSEGKLDYCNRKIAFPCRPLV